MDVNLWRMLLVSHSQLVCCIAYRHTESPAPEDPPPHNNSGNVMSRRRRRANRNEIQIGNCYLSCSELLLYG